LELKFALSEGTAMSGTNKLSFVITIFFGFIGAASLVDYRAITPVAAAETSLEGMTSLPALGLSRRSLKLVSVVPLAAEGQTLAIFAVYDDPSTQRTEDYLELYERNGELVAIGCFDEFGIERMAVDRALIEGGDSLQGVFVTVLDGESI
jgi:hypothetical protein